MSPLEMLSAALDNGEGLYNFARGGEMYLLLVDLAGIDGRVASKAVEDALHHSSRPRDQLNQAEGALRQAHEKFSAAAKPTSFFKKVRAATLSLDGPEKSTNKALLSAATTALTAAEVTRLAGNPGMRSTWLNRAEADFALYKTRAKPEEPQPRDFIADPNQYGLALIGYDRLKKKFDRNEREFEAALRKAKSKPNV